MTSDSNENDWDQFISQYPVYDSTLNPIEYDLSKGTVCGHKYLTPHDLLNKANGLFVDNSTLFDSHIILGLENNLISIDENLIESPSVNLCYEVLVKITNDLVLNEQLFVDGFVFSNSPRARTVASIFPDIIKPICFSNEDRIRLHELISTGFTDFNEQFEEFSREDHSFHDGKNVDLNFFNRWWVVNGHKVTTNLTPPDNDRLFRDLAIPKHLRSSELHSYRTAYYLAISEFCGLPYSPHPCRNVILGSFLFDTLLTKDRILEYFDENVRQPIIDKQNKIFRKTITFNAPLVLATVLGLMKKGASYSQSIYHLRSMKSLMQYRDWCDRLHTALSAEQEGLAEANKLTTELENYVDIWKNDLDEGYKYKTRKVTAGLVAGVLKADIEGFRDPYLFKPKKGLVFLNDLMRSVDCSDQIGYRNNKSDINFGEILQNITNKVRL